jgi:hypothetical protein
VFPISTPPCSTLGFITKTTLINVAFHISLFLQIHQVSSRCWILIKFNNCKSISGLNKFLQKFHSTEGVARMMDANAC